MNGHTSPAFGDAPVEVPSFIGSTRSRGGDPRSPTATELDFSTDYGNLAGTDWRDTKFLMSPLPAPTMEGVGAPEPAHREPSVPRSPPGAKVVPVDPPHSDEHHGEPADGDDDEEVGDDDPHHDHHRESLAATEVDPEQLERDRINAEIDRKLEADIRNTMEIQDVKTDIQRLCKRLNMKVTPVVDDPDADLAHLELIRKLYEAELDAANSVNSYMGIMEGGSSIIEILINKYGKKIFGDFTGFSRYLMRNKSEIKACLLSIRKTHIPPGSVSDSRRLATILSNNFLSFVLERKAVPLMERHGIKIGAGVLNNKAFDNEDGAKVGGVGSAPPPPPPPPAAPRAPAARPASLPPLPPRPAGAALAPPPLPPRPTGAALAPPTPSPTGENINALKREVANLHSVIASIRDSQDQMAKTMAALTARLSGPASPASDPADSPPPASPPARAAPRAPPSVMSGVHGIEMM